MDAQIIVQVGHAVPLQGIEEQQRVAVPDERGVGGHVIENVEVDPARTEGFIGVHPTGFVGVHGERGFQRAVGIAHLGVGEVAIPIVSGEIAEDITAYYATSEQIPTVCALGVLVNPDKTVACAGGFIIQLLPAADEATITAVENCISRVKPVTAMLADGMTPEEICKNVLDAFDMEILDEFDVSFKCDCSRHKVERALISTGAKELEDMSNDSVTSVKCQFCGTSYDFSPEDIRRLLIKATK